MISDIAKNKANLNFGPFSLCFSIGSHYGEGRRELGCREMKKQKKEI